MEQFFESLGLPLHPMTVHYPIALFIASLIFLTLGNIFQKDHLKQTAWHCFLLATAVIPFSVLSGLEEAQEWHLTSHRVFLLHKYFALTTFVLSIVALSLLLFIRKKSPHVFQTGFVLSLILIVAFVVLTAHQGGRLVYQYSIGIEDHP